MDWNTLKFTAAVFILLMTILMLCFWLSADSIRSLVVEIKTSNLVFATLYSVGGWLLIDALFSDWIK